MNCVKKRVNKNLALFLLSLLMFGSFPCNALAAESPSQANISNQVTYWAQQYNIPPVVLKAIAWQESTWRQYKSDGSTLIGYDGIGIGIMQISDYARGLTKDRIYGNERIGTSIKVAEKFVSATTAILAPSADANLVDALAAAPLAGKTSPILLTDNNILTEATKAELIKLKVSKVYVVGAINTAVVEQVKAIPGITEVIPLKGANRIETAAKISAQLTSPAGTFVIGYNGLPDALSVASYAAANNYSILVTNPDGSLPASANKAGKVYTIGGIERVKPIPGVASLAGSDRFATNKVVLNTLTYSYNKAYVANGTDAHLVDSLVVSPLAASVGAPIILTDTAACGDATIASIGAKLSSSAVVVALGGDQVVTDKTVTKVIAAAPARTAADLAYINRLKTDYDFNISEGARILNQKWRTVPKIGDGDRNKLENWYFAVWAYNGWSARNNPNYARDHGIIAYQDRVYQLMAQNYKPPYTPIYQTTPWDNSALPESLPPSYDSTWSTPTSYHTGDLTINATRLLSGGGSAAEPANGDYWYNYPASSTAIYSLGYYVTGYNALSDAGKQIFSNKLIAAAKKVTAYGESRLNSAKTMGDVQVALKNFWAVKQLPNLDATTWHKAQVGYDNADKALQAMLLAK
ncbi:MAG TPA: cell wall-binding repeat-containing protein [Desulfosporosinus sp.]|nr:cell wall-binding repeat-containing protein [Desulfosporosinus sp.]